MHVAVQGNLSEQAYNARLRQGLFFLGLSLAMTVLFVRMGWHPAARLLLFGPFFGAALCGIQGIYRTCVFAAKHGVRVTECGAEPVCALTDREELRRQGRGVTLLSAVTGALATAAALALP